MGTYKIKDLRNLDINIYQYVSSCLSNDGYTVISSYSIAHTISGVYLVDGFPEDLNNIKLPSVAIEHINTSQDGFQLGTGREEDREFSIEIYARSDGERDDLSETVKDYFFSSIPIYDYNQVIASGVYNQLALADFNYVNMYPNKDPEFKATKYRMTINFSCNYIINSGVSLIT